LTGWRNSSVRSNSTTEQEDETTAETPSEQEHAALEILFHEPHRERIRLSVGRLGDSEVAFIVYAAPATETAESGSERILFPWPSYSLRSIFST
jgi:hypothetical protein